MKIAIVHDYLNQKGGAERVFEMFCEHFPHADIYTSIYDPQKTIELGSRKVSTTFIQKIPGSKKYFRLFAPLYFPAFRTLNLKSYDLILSSSSSFAKVVKRRPGATHICFCHNVSRFLWDTRTYLEGYKEFELFKLALEPIFWLMKKLDLKYASEPDLYVANSTVVAERIRNIYKQPAITINYPINHDCFTFSSNKENFYLVSSRLLSYKRVDLIVEAFNQLGWPLFIIGCGPEQKRLESKAAGNVQVLGHVDDNQRRYFFSKAKAVIVAALEDYGLVPIEANFSGTPVVAYGAGGVLDTQVPYLTGLFFDYQTTESLKSALAAFQTVDWDYSAIRHHAKINFSGEVFFDKVKQLIEKKENLPVQKVLSRQKAFSSPVGKYR